MRGFSTISALTAAAFVDTDHARAESLAALPAGVGVEEAALRQTARARNMPRGKTRPRLAPLAREARHRLVAVAHRAADDVRRPDHQVVAARAGALQLAGQVAAEAHAHRAPGGAADVARQRAVALHEGGDADLVARLGGDADLQRAGRAGGGRHEDGAQEESDAVAAHDGLDRCCCQGDLRPGAPGRRVTECPVPRPGR